MNRKQLITAAACSASLIVAGLTNSSLAAKKGNDSNDSSNLVTICHFNGHDGDFVTLNSQASPNNFCVNRGGNPITVGENACENGHRAETLARFGLDCSDGHLQGN